MAINSIILEMTAAGQAATMELEGGKWCHTPEYLKRRYGSGIKRQPRPAPAQVESPERRMAGDFLRKLTPAERALLMAQLVEE